MCSCAQASPTPGTDAMLRRLIATGRVRSAAPRLQPLAGGVSSDIWLVEDGADAFVVKRARARLAVRDEWLADPARNTVECRCLRYLRAIQPGCVPELRFEDIEAQLFGMEFVRGANWKAELLAGRVREHDAARAGSLLGTIHRHSWNDPAARRQFDAWKNFHDLRAHAYLTTTGLRHPQLRLHFDSEVERLRTTPIALVHGDFSPKNILLEPARLVLLDCEVAWFGDPAFDAAFALNHLFLKSIQRPELLEPCLRLTDVFWSEYGRALECLLDSALAARIGRLLLMLMLARIDGKSPVEYLDQPGQKDFVRLFVSDLLPARAFDLPEIRRAWRTRRLAS